MGYVVYILRGYTPNNADQSLSSQGSNALDRVEGSETNMTCENCKQENCQGCSASAQEGSTESSTEGSTPEPATEGSTDGGSTESSPEGTVNQ